MPTIGLTLFLIGCYTLGVQLVVSGLVAWLGPLWLWRATLLAESGFLLGLLSCLHFFAPHRLGLRPVSWSEGVQMVFWFQAIAFASDAAILWLAPPGLIDDYLAVFQPVAPSEWVALAAVAAGTAPVIEEVLFRGLLLAALRRRLAIGGAVFGSTVLFALIHLKPVQILAALPMGFMLAAYVAWGGSLYVTTATHIFGNSFSFLGLLFPGIPWISADWRPTTAQGLGSLGVAVILFGGLLRRYPINK